MDKHKFYAKLNVTKEAKYKLSETLNHYNCTYCKKKKKQQHKKNMAHVIAQIGNFRTLWKNTKNKNNFWEIKHFKCIIGL
jgi:hypothetical protein